MALIAEPTIRGFKAPAPLVLTSPRTPRQPDVYIEQVRAAAPADPGAAQRRANDAAVIRKALFFLPFALGGAPQTTRTTSRILFAVGTKAGRPALSPALGLYVLPQPFGAVNPEFYQLRGNYLRGTTRSLGLPPIESELLHAYEDNPATEARYRALALAGGAESYRRYTFLLETHELENDLLLFERGGRRFFALGDLQPLAAPLAAYAAEALRRRAGGEAKAQAIYDQILEEHRQRARIPVLRALGGGPVGVQGGVVLSGTTSADQPSASVMVEEAHSRARGPVVNLASERGDP